jgi:hypothetical protein
MKSARLLFVAIALWLVAGALGFGVLLHYEQTAGSFSSVPERWPSASQIRRSNSFTLLMFIHPKCPCSRASIAELNRLLVHSHGNVSTKVVLLQPVDMPSDWATGQLWDSAAFIPGVEVLADTNASEAQLFGAETSGFTLLYDNQNRLLFKGGITAGRGHSGENAGARALVSILNGMIPAKTNTPTFGCDLFGT